MHSLIWLSQSHHLPWVAKPSICGWHKQLCTALMSSTSSECWQWLLLTLVMMGCVQCQQTETASTPNLLDFGRPTVSHFTAGLMEGHGELRGCAEQHCWHAGTCSPGGSETMTLERATLEQSCTFGSTAAHVSFITVQLYLRLCSACSLHL